MADPIRLKRSSTPGAVPTAGQLQVGELAVNSADGKLFTKLVDGTIVPLGAGGGQQVGDLLTTLRNPGSTYLKTDGGIYLQAAYPALFALVGLTGGAQGLQWTGLNPAPAVGNVQAFASDGKGVVVSSTAGAPQFHRSADYGRTWTDLTVPVNTYAHAIATDANGVWIATLAIGNGIIRSTDNGITWTLISLAGNVTAIDTDRKGVWVAAGSAASNGGFRSADNGLTWTASAARASLGALKTDRNGVWISTNATSWVRSTDNGLTWLGSAGSAPTLGMKARTNREGLWLCTNGNAIRRSTDNGASFQSVTATGGLSNIVDGTVTADGTWLAIPNSGTAIYRSEDAGLTWSAVPSALTVAGSAIHYVGNEIVLAGQSNLPDYRISLPAYGYDPATQFKIPRVIASGELFTTYIKALEAA